MFLQNVGIYLPTYLATFLHGVTEQKTNTVIIYFILNLNNITLMFSLLNVFIKHNYSH
jgi:hypothetical protein